MSKAIVFTGFGAADVLHAADVPVAEPGPGQVRIAVRTAGVNALDHKIRAGYLEQVFPVTFPHVPGLEAAGVVDAVGEGVGGLVVGDPVFGTTVTGAYAQQALADAARMTLKPDTFDWEQAAALPVAAETSYRAFELLGVQPGETLLVHAAAGAVGGVAVQIAVARGLTVIGTASEANHEHLRSLGAIPVAYGDGLVERVRALAPQGVDAALDGAGRGGAIADSVELTGGKDRVVSIADAVGAGEHGVRFTSGGPEEYRGGPALEEALGLLAAGRLRLPVHRVFPLDEAAAAHRESESGHVTGKIVLTV
ncbi:NADP-dependent oxidoreductase [Streptomyces sp. V4-01]|uniref:NADP-dependent oxidoreductase n=1 Tax=Actinacidiphila polyblastidii TaxID=3110430 RepID=A0ABU7P528_9ACTN|nr:NADP-dependent oxidoreductase [Streptomyces sp. V4-01]